MRTIHLIIAGIIFSIAGISAQNHNLRYYSHQENIYKIWVLEEKTNYRTFSNIVSPDGIQFYNYAAEFYDFDNLAEGRELVKEILLPILPRYESQELVNIIHISYIILPDGSVDEVSFQFMTPDDKLDITEEEMIVWQKLSDALKQNLKITISCEAPEIPFGRLDQTIHIPNLLKPEPLPTVQNSDTAKKKLYIRRLTPEEAEKRRKEREAAEIVMTLKD